MEQAVVSLGGTAIRAFVSMSQNRRPSGDCVLLASWSGSCLDKCLTSAFFFFLSLEALTFVWSFVTDYFLKKGKFYF